MTAELRDAIINTLFSIPGTVLLNYTYTKLVSVRSK